MTSRAQRLAQYLATHPGGVSARQARDYVDPAASMPVIAAQMCQLVIAGKARRTGAAMHTTYFPTPLTLVDKRKTPTRRARKAKAPKPKPTPKPAPKKAARPKPAHRQQTQAQRLIFIKPARLTGNRETVAEFLARGGRIQKLKPGEASTPLFECVRALNDKSMRKRLVTADNDPEDDDEFAGFAIA